MKSWERTVQKPGNRKERILKTRCEAKVTQVGGGRVCNHTRAPDFKPAVSACASGASVVRSLRRRQIRYAGDPGAEPLDAGLPGLRGLRRARDPGLGGSHSPRPLEAPPPALPPPRRAAPSLRLDARGRVAGARAFAAPSCRSPALRCVELEAAPGFRRRVLLWPERFRSSRAGAPGAQRRGRARAGPRPHTLFGAPSSAWSPQTERVPA